MVAAQRGIVYICPESAHWSPFSLASCSYLFSSSMEILGEARPTSKPTRVSQATFSHQSAKGGRVSSPSSKRLGNCEPTAARNSSMTSTRCSSHPRFTVPAKESIRLGFWFSVRRSRQDNESILYAILQRQTRRTWKLRK